MHARRQTITAKITHCLLPCLFARTNDPIYSRANFYELPRHLVYWNRWAKPILVEIERKRELFFFYRTVHVDLRERSKTNEDRERKK